MKERTVILLILFTVLITLNGCNGNGQEEEQSDFHMQIEIEADYSKELVVPDPETAGNDVSVVMRYVPDFEEYEAYAEQDQCVQSCQVDLSFLGFENKMTVLAYQIGAVTGHTSEYASVQFHIPEDYPYQDQLPLIRHREIHGNCLVMVAKDFEKDEENYIVVLDYENHKSYLQKTSIWNPKGDHFPELRLCDFTGDGLDDIVISNSLNDNAVNAQIFRMKENGLQCIYEHLDNGGGRETMISGYLADDYKAVIEYEPLGLKKVKSLLDLGYTKKQLDSDDPIQSDHYPFRHVYQDGKVKKDIGDRDIWIDMAQNMKICQPNDYDQVISYTHFVTFAKYNSVCRLKVYLKYNEENDDMEIYKIGVKWINV